MSPMSPLSCISADMAVRCPYPHLTLSAISILFCISDVFFFLPYLCCGPHCIVFNCPVSFNAAVSLLVSWVSYVSSAASIYYRSQISSVALTISNPPYPLPLLLFPRISYTAIVAPPFIGPIYFYRRHPLSYDGIVLMICCRPSSVCHRCVIHLLLHSTFLGRIFLLLLDLLVMKCSAPLFSLWYDLLTALLSSLLALIFSLSSPIFLLLSYLPSFYPLAFTPLQSYLLILLSSVWSALIAPYPLCSTLIYPLIMFSYFFSLHCFPGLDWIGLVWIADICSVFYSYGPSNFS